MVNVVQFSFSLPYTGPKILLYTFLSKMFVCFLSVFVSIQVPDAHVKVLSIVVFFSCCMLLLITCTFHVSNNRYSLPSDTGIQCLNAKWQGSSKQNDASNGVNH